MGAVQIQKVNWWHERLADWMIANPDKTMKDAARYFNCTAEYLYILKNSDSFKQYWSTRSQEASSGIVADVKDKMLALTEIALERLTDKLNNQGELMQTEQLVSVASMGMKSLGYGVAKGATVQVNTYNVSPDILAIARERMNQKYGVEAAPAAEVIEATTVDLLAD